jgi:hypothetical protein
VLSGCGLSHIGQYLVLEYQGMCLRVCRLPRAAHTLHPRGDPYHSSVTSPAMHTATRKKKTPKQETWGRGVGRKGMAQA